MYVLIIFIKALLTILLAIILLLFMILFIPFKYHINGKVKEVISGDIFTSWLFGLIAIEFVKAEEKPKIKIYLLKHCIYSNEIGESKKSHKKKNKTSEKKNKEPFKLPEKQFIIEGINFFKDILSILKPRIFIIRGCYGLDDPSTTGIICMLINMVQGVLPSCKIYLDPVFQDEIIDIEIEAAGDLKIFMIAYKIIRFIGKKEVRKNIFKKSKKAETIKEN